MSAAEKKKEGKLKKFLDKTKDGGKRFKALMEFIEKCASDNEVEQMFKANAFEIFSVEHEAFNAYELSLKKSKPHEQTVINLHSVLRKILTHLADNIKQRWHIRNVAGMIEKSLNILNKPQFRTTTFELLLYFYMDLGEPEKEFLALLPQAIDLQPFVTADGFSPTTAFRTRPLLNSDVVLVPRQSPGVTKEESLELLTVLFNFLTDKPVNFDQWFTWFKVHFLTVFYPLICKHIGLLSPEDETGFKDHCPYDIQALFVEKLIIWFANDNIISYLWSNDNAQIMLEIFRQACLIPVTRLDTIKKYLAVYHDMLFVKTPRGLPEANLTVYRKWFFEKLIYVVPDGAMSPDHIKLVNEVLAYYRRIVAKNWQSLYPEIRETIFYSALDLASRALARPDSGKEDRTLCPSIIDAVLYVWIRAKTVDPRMWQLLHDRIRTFFHRKDTIAQIKLKLIQMTLVLEKYLYTFEAYDKYLEKKNKTAASGASQKKLYESQTPDFREPIEYKPDPFITQVDWDYPTAQSIWYDLLEIYRPLNSWEDPSFYQDGMECLCSIVDMLLSAYNRADFLEDLSTRPFISLISVFGPWLFEATRRPAQFVEGRALAFRTLCRIVCRHSQINLPKRLLAHFYDAIQLGLVEASGTKVAWAIMEHTSNIFSLSLPGSSVLIPIYLLEIKSIFNKAESVPAVVREVSLMMLSSLLNYPTHFRGLQLPVDQELLKRRAAEDDFGKSIDFKDLKSRISTTLMFALSKDLLPLHQSIAMSAMSSLIITELHAVQDATSNELILNLVKGLIGCTLRDHIFSPALSALSHLAAHHDLLVRADDSIASKIVNQLAANIASKIQTSGQETLVAEHFYCMLEWLMRVPVKFFDDSKLVKKIFWVLDLGLTASKVTNSVAEAASFSGGISGGVALGASGSIPGEASAAAPPDPRAKLRRVAEQLIYYIGNMLLHFPPDRHYDILTSQVTDIDLEEPSSAIVKPSSPAPGMTESLGSAQETAAGAGVDQGAGLLAPTPQLASSGEKPPSVPRPPTLFLTNNFINIYSFQDVAVHDPLVLSEDGVQALQWALANPHYLHFFTAYLAMAELESAIGIWYEFQQTEAGGGDLAGVRHKAKLVVSNYLGSQAAASLPPEYPPILQQKLGDRPEGALFDLLLIQFAQFRHTDLFHNAQEHIARLFVRDAMGKYTWDWKIEYDWPQYELIARKQATESRYEATAISDAIPDEFWEEETPATNLTPTDEAAVSHVNDLNGLLRYLTDTRPDCFNAVGEQVLYNPLPLPADHAPLVKEFEDLLTTQDSINQAKLQHKSVNRPSSDTWGCLLPEPALKLGKMHSTRLLLAHLGWLSFERSNFFTLLDFENPKLKRALRQVDTSAYGREVAKVGLVYVAPGQEDERSMFRNEQGSALYQEFVEGMTATVGIEKHRGYLGGLDRSGNVGVTLPYYRSPTTEFCYHEVVRMPTVHKDPQQIHKKRHVGNDIVHVIWSEHTRDYSPQTIVSQFNDVHIIIYPLPNGLFRVQVAQKKDVGHFGPLIHNCVVTKELLPMFTRQSAATANQVVRFANETYLGQFTNRKDNVNEIVKRQHVKKLYNDYLFELFRLNVDAPPTGAAGAPSTSPAK